MKKLFLFVFLINFLYCASFQYTLKDYINFCSKHNNISILVSDNIDPSIFNYYTDEKNPVITIDMLKEMLNSLNLNLLKYDNFYFIDFKKFDGEIIKMIDGSNSLFKVDLKFNNKDEVLKILNLYDVNSTYIDSSNQIYYSYPNDNIQKNLSKYLNNLDIPPKQLKIKITIVETNLNKIKERGAEISSYLKSLPGDTFNYFLNLITMPFNATSNVVNTSSAGYYGVLRYLDTNGLTNIISSPFLLLRSNKEVYFSSVENVPYLVQNREFKDDGVSVTSSYDYKDIGLKLKLYPVILDNGSVDLDFDLTIENLLNSNNDKPITSKRQLKSSYILNRGELLILSGINQKTKLNNFYKVPLLSDIWFIGDLFKYYKDEYKITNLSIGIEII